MNTFNRENRYIVIKLTDAYSLPTYTKEKLQEVLHEVHHIRKRRGKEDLSCVVIEDDWPEYEPVWSLLEKRMSRG